MAILNFLHLLFVFNGWIISVAARKNCINAFSTFLRNSGFKFTVLYKKKIKEISDRTIWLEY